MKALAGVILNNVCWKKKHQKVSSSLPACIFKIIFLFCSFDWVSRSWAFVYPAVILFSDYFWLLNINTCMLAGAHTHASWVAPPPPLLKTVGFCLDDPYPSATARYGHLISWDLASDCSNNLWLNTAARVPSSGQTAPCWGQSNFWAL